MKRVKYEAPRHTKRGAGGKTIALLLALMLVVCGVIGGTMAWLTDTTQEVKNTFTTSDIDITLAETTGNAYKMVPGYDIAKDPKVTVLKGSEKCYLFVKVEKSENLDSYITYTMAEGWTQLTGETGVYYRIVEANATDDQTFSVLSGDKVTVLGTVTKADMTTAETDKPTLTFTAYASQYWKTATTNFTPEEAWNNVKPTSTPTT